jgi:SAM-dependent methyltransferase
MTMTIAPAVTESTDEFVGRALGDFGAAITVALVRVGDRLGLYRALAGAPQTAAELAASTGTVQALVEPWLVNQAASGYLDHDPETGRFTLPAHREPVFADESSAVYFGGFAEIITSIYADSERVVAAFRGERSLPWHEHDGRLFTGTERFFRPGYAANLVPSWIPALDGVEAKLRRGAHVADVGCGHGVSTLLLAEAYPASTFVGSDYHPASVARAGELAREAGVADRVRFEVGRAEELAGGPYDLVCLFDSLHDMGDPVAALRGVRARLAPGGTVMLVEPKSEDDLADNLNPVGRVYAAASAAVCTPNGLAQGGHPLGAIAGPRRTAEVAAQAGFTGFRTATSTPFTAVYELTP